LNAEHRPPGFLSWCFSKHLPFVSSGETFPLYYFPLFGGSRLLLLRLRFFRCVAQYFVDDLAKNAHY
jgi:hypothetical protein